MLQLSPLQHAHAKSVINKKTPLQLMGINSLVCGIEIASSCAFTYISPMLLKAGFSETAMTIILGIAPVIDLLTVPVLAEWSDGCRSKYGRRQPFIIGISVLVIFSLLLIPLSSILFINRLFESQSVYMVLLAAGVILFDYSYQALFNPCESLLVDVVASEKSHESLAFTIYSACLSLGCILGYLIVSINWSILVPYLTREQSSFLLVAVLFVICLSVTLTCAKEKTYFYYSQDYSDIINSNYLKEDFASLLATDCSTSKESFDFGLKGSCGHFVKSICKFTRKVQVKCIYVIWKIISLPKVCYSRVRNSPNVIRQLFYTELFGWTSILCHNMFFTDFVGQYIYHGVPMAPNPSKETSLYDEGIAVGSWALFLQSLAACSYAFCVQQYAVKMFGVKIVFLLGMSTFAVCMLGTIFCSSDSCLNAFTSVSGVGLAALTTMPNMLVTLYSQDQELYMWDVSSHKSFAYGTHVAVLDTAYFLSQVILSVSMGPIVDYTKSSLSYLIVSTCACLLSVWFGLKVVYCRKDLSNENLHV